MATQYQSLLQIEGTDPSNLGIVDEQIHSWLMSKHFNADAVSQEGRTELTSDAWVWRGRQKAGNAFNAKFKLVERNSNTGIWTTTITSHFPSAYPGWVLVEVENRPIEDDSSTQGSWAAAPRVARYLLDSLPVRDGEARLTSRPERAFAGELDHLIETVCDPDRRGLVFVAAAPHGEDVGQWTNYVERVTRETVGLAATYVIDPFAAEELNRAFGPSHAVPSGAIRTFLPSADPASVVDGRRHRILGTATLSSSSEGRIRGILGTVARARVSDAELPNSISKVLRSMSRWETHQLVTDDVGQHSLAVPSVQPESVRQEGARQEKKRTFVHRALRANRPERVKQEKLPSRIFAARKTTPDWEPVLASLVEAVLGKPETINVDTLSLAIATAHERTEAVMRLWESVDEITDSLEAARAQNVVLQGTAEDVELDAAIEVERVLQLQESVAGLEKENQRLRLELNERGAGDVAWAIGEVEPALPPPMEMAELLERAKELEFVQITGDRDPILELDVLDPIGRVAVKAWQALLALDDYARATDSGGYSGGFHGYCQQSPPGYRSWSAEKHAPSESTTVRNSTKLRNMRRFSVPAEVSDDGSVFMFAHCKLVTSRSISPRLYYLDDVAGTGRIYVGYIGRHLPNKSTN